MKKIMFVVLGALILSGCSGMKSWDDNRTTQSDQRNVNEQNNSKKDPTHAPESEPTDEDDSQQPGTKQDTSKDDETLTPATVDEKVEKHFEKDTTDANLTGPAAVLAGN